MKRNAILIAICGVLAALVAGAPASAKDGDVLAAGKCSGASTAKLKLSREDRADRGRVRGRPEPRRRPLDVVLKSQGRQAARLVRVTGGPSGSFTARKLVANAAGADVVTATARRAGETCTAKVTFPA